MDNSFKARLQTLGIELIKEKIEILQINVGKKCNLCVLFEPGQEYLADFLAVNGVEIIASLPCYTKENVDKQRGKGVFEKSIEALLLLNRLGYAQEGTGLLLNLVFNPTGARLPPPQKELEKDYKKRLFKNFGIVFNNLYTMTNMPVLRHAKYLQQLKRYDGYIDLLVNSFNPHVIPDLMCRNTLSLGWDGKLYDCDFNQMLGMQLNNGKTPDIFNVSSDELKGLGILTGNHCFGCTAGSGSGCQGVLKNV